MPHFPRLHRHTPQHQQPPNYGPNYAEGDFSAAGSGYQSAGYPAVRTTGFGDLNYGGFSYGGGRGYGGGVGTTLPSPPTPSSRYDQGTSTVAYTTPSYSSYGGGSVGDWLQLDGGYTRFGQPQPHTSYAESYGGAGTVTDPSYKSQVYYTDQGQGYSQGFTQQYSYGTTPLGSVGQQYAKQHGINPTQTPATITNPSYLFGTPSSFNYGHPQRTPQPFAQQQGSFGEWGAGGGQSPHHQAGPRAFGAGQQHGGNFGAQQGGFGAPFAQQGGAPQGRLGANQQGFGGAPQGFGGQQGFGGGQQGFGAPQGGRPGGQGGFPPFPPYGMMGNEPSTPGSPGTPGSGGFPPFPFFGPPPGMMPFGRPSGPNDSLPVSTQMDGEGKLVPGYWEWFSDSQGWTRLTSDVGSTLDHHLGRGIATASQVIQGEQYSFNLTKMEAVSGGKSKQIRRVPTAPTVAKGGNPPQPSRAPKGGDDFYGSGMDTFTMTSSIPAARNAPEVRPPVGANPYDTPPKERPTPPTRPPSSGVNVPPPMGQTPYDTPPKQRPGESF